MCLVWQSALRQRNKNEWKQTLKKSLKQLTQKHKKRKYTNLHDTDIESIRVSPTVEIEEFII